MGKAKRKVNYAALDKMMDNTEARLSNVMDPLERIKIIVNEMLKFPGTSEKSRLDILEEMENGGYEAFMDYLEKLPIPPGFDPANRPWKRN
jgi:hypothetical protein